MFNENRNIFFEVVPPYKRRKGRGMESYRPPKKFSETVSGKMEKIEREVSGEEANRVLEKLDEFGELKCPKCGSTIITEDDSDSDFYKFKCFDCGYEWSVKR
jgi:predicted RNA-binding Zn-ribbon protein involved in translation (DUF1610 family)